MKSNFLRKTLMIVCTLTVALSATACGNSKKAADNETNVTLGVNKKENTNSNNNDSNAAENDDTNTDAASNSDYSKIANYTYTFSSGVGAWASELKINADGTFVGSYRDSDMGSNGADYPNGTEYISYVTGKFGPLTKSSDYSYETTVKKIDYEVKPEKEFISADGIKYCFTYYNGLSEDSKIIFYMQDAPIDQLPNEFVDWVKYAGNMNNNSNKLPFAGLYSINDQAGFSGTLKAEDLGVSDMRDEIEKTNILALECEMHLQNDALSQNEMNRLSEDMYKLWDDQLNSEWAFIKSVLSEERMETLTEEQRKWIADKEAKVKAAGAVSEGGSMQPFLENTKASSLTKERVYELMSQLY